MIPGIGINTSEIEIEMNDIAEINHEINQSLVEGKKKKSKFHVYETNWQCPGITMAGCSCFVAFIGALITAVGLTIALTQTDISYQWAGYAITVIGAGILGCSLINFVAHCITCSAIGHYIPRRAFETDIGLLTVQNQQLQQNLNFLKEERDQWKTLVEGQKIFSLHQEEMTKNLRETLDKYAKDLSLKVNELSDCLVKLNKAEEAVTNLEKQLQDIKASLITFGETNSQFKKNLYNLDFMTAELNEQEVEWDNDLKDFSQGNNEYERLNNQAEQLRSVLEKQLNVMGMFREALESGFKKLALQAESLDISDDKFRDASNKLLQVTKEKEKAIQTNAKLLETLDRVLTVLSNLEEDNPKFDELRQSLMSLSESSENE